jgi:hypothetical protein
MSIRSFLLLQAAIVASSWAVGCGGDAERQQQRDDTSNEAGGGGAGGTDGEESGPPEGSFACGDTYCRLGEEYCHATVSCCNSSLPVIASCVPLDDECADCACLIDEDTCSVPFSPSCSGTAAAGLEVRCNG